MPNRDIISGLTPVNSLNSSDYQGKLRQIAFAGNDGVACFLGDLVKLTGTVDATGKIPVVAQIAAGEASIGVLVALDPDFANESFANIYRLADTARTGYILQGQDVLYEIQEDSDANDIEIAEAGWNINVIVGTGDTVTGVSGMEIDSNTAAATDSLNLRLHHIARKPDNVLGTNAIWVVSINNSQEALNQTGT